MTTEIVTGNICRKLETESSMTSFSGRNVIQFRPRKPRNDSSKDKALDHFDRWARFTGHGKGSGVIEVIN